MFFAGRSDVDGGVSSPLPGKYHVDDFFFTLGSLWAVFMFSDTGLLPVLC